MYARTRTDLNPESLVEVVVSDGRGVLGCIQVYAYRADLLVTISSSEGSDKLILASTFTARMPKA